LPKSSAGKSGGNNFSNTAALDKMLADAKIGPELIGSLATGLTTFGDKVASISRVTDAGDATIAFTAKVKQATASYDNLSVAFEKASSNLSELASTNIDSKSYHDQIHKMAKNLTALNAVYELELQDTNNHLKAMNSFYSNLAQASEAMNGSIADAKKTQEQVALLAKNLGNLNHVYGNMLSAMQGRQ